MLSLNSKEAYNLNNNFFSFFIIKKNMNREFY